MRQWTSGISQGIFLLTFIFAGSTAVAKGNSAPTKKAGTSASAKKDIKVDIVIETSLGTMEAQLNQTKAPITVKNFLNYIEGKSGDRKFYNDTIFHRVISGFMIQGGGFTEQLKKKPTDAAIKNEANNGLKNTKGTLAMARTPDPHSATSQFFINHSDNTNLDFTSETTRGWGYAVFGELTSGQDVLEKIAAVATGNSGPMQNVPTTPVKIISIQRKNPAK